MGNCISYQFCEPKDYHCSVCGEGLSCKYLQCENCNRKIHFKCTIHKEPNLTTCIFCNNNGRLSIVYNENIDPLSGKHNKI